MDISEAKKVLEEVLTRLSIAVKRVEVVAGDPHPFLSVTTADSGVLIGIQGEHLRALNYLVKKILEARHGGSIQNEQPFLIDVNGYYRKRMIQLKQQARILAERARAYKADVEMEPVNAYERLIVHDVFSNDPEIYTESVGVGKGRHIVFKYKHSTNTLVNDKALFSDSPERAEK